MAGPSRTLKLTYLGDASQLKKTNQELEGNFGKLGGSVKKLGIAAGAAFAAAGAAAVVVGKKLFDAGEAAATANARIQNITQSMGNFGENADQVTNKLIKTANTLAVMTGVERNTIKETQALLLTFNSINKTADEASGVFDRATAAAIDLAAAGFGNATTNAQQLGKALEDPIKGLTSLTRSGVTFTEAERERIKTLVESNRLGEAQSLILDAIEKQVGATSLATANASDRIRESFGVIVDEIALSLAPTFEKLTDAVTRLISKFAEWWRENGPRVIEVIQKTVERGIELWNVIRQNVEPIVRKLIQTFGDLIGRFREWWERVSPAVFEAFGRVRDAIVRVWDSVKPLITTIRDLFGTLFGGVSEGGEGKLFESFLNILVSVIEAVAAAVSFAFDEFKRFFDLIKRIAENPIVQGLLSGIGSAVSAIGRFFGGGSGTQVAAATTQASTSLSGQMQQRYNNAVMNITVNGATDPENVARQLAKLTQDAQRRSGPTQTLVFAP